MSSTVSNSAQAIFKRIVVHNKLMDEATADRLLTREPDPEKAIQFLVQQQKIKAELGQQLLTLFRRQMEKQPETAVPGNGANAAKSPSPAPPKPAAAKPSEDDFFASLVDDALATSDASQTIAPDEDDDDLTASDSEAAPAAAAAAPVTAPLAVDADPEIVAAVGPKVARRDDLPLLELDTDEEEPATPQEKSPAPAAAKSAPAAAPTATPPTVAVAKPAAKVTVPATAASPAPKRDYDPLMIKLLKAARAAEASDLHIKSGAVPLLRIAGSLREMENQAPLTAEEVEAGLLTLVSEAHQERYLSTNDLDFCFDGGKELGRYRANYLRQHRGMDGIFRLISADVPSFEQLKLPPMVKKFTDYKQGIVLVTGPKGCGKTTTLAAMVDLINSTRAEHIITIEDPIEFVHPCKEGHVNQREVGAHTESFSNALRAALREAPDVIMVGEMRDLETTSLAITAAETGHLVFATLHTPDAIRTIDRVLDVFPPKEQGQIRSMISESMRGIISQLLLPSVDGNHQELAVEILVNTTAIGNLIREEKTFQLRGIMQTGRRLGMQLMDDSLIELAKSGRIAKEEAIAVATEQARVREVLK